MRLIPRPWLPLLGVVVMAFNLRGALAVTPPLLGVLERDIGLTPAQASLLGALSPLAFAVAGFIGLGVMRRFGLERSAWLAMSLGALGQLGRIAVQNSPAFLAFTALCLIALGIGNVVMPPLVKRYFPEQVGMVTGFYAVVMQMGVATAAQSAVPLSARGGWELSLGVWVVLGVAAALPWLLISRRIRIRESPDLGPPAAMGGHIPLRLVARSPLAWGLALLLGIQSLIAYAVIAWLPTIYRDAGMPESIGGTALAVFGLFQIPLSLIAPIIVNRIPRPFLLMVGFAIIYVLAFLGLALAPDSQPFLWAALLGLGSGPFPLALALIGLRAETAAGAASLSSFAQGLGYVVAIAGPLATGFLRAQSGGWQVPLAFLGALLIPLLIGGWMVARPRTMESEIGIAPH